MRIIGLKASNVKRIRCIDLTPNDHINRISGANGSGKTSVLDAIEWLLTGTSTVPSQPVRKGSGKAVIAGILGDESGTGYTVRRTFTEGGSRNGVLALESENGKNRIQGPQEILDKLTGGSRSFDPLTFLRMHPKKQLEVLKSLVKFDTDFDMNMRVEDDPDYLRRREAKKEKVAVETRRDAVYVPADLPKAKVDEAGLVEELKQASSFNADIERLQRERNDTRDSFEAINKSAKAKADKILELRAEIERVEIAMRQDLDRGMELQKEIARWPSLPEPKDAAKLAEQIDAARKANQGIDKRTLRDQYQAEADALEVEITNLSAALDEREAKRAEALATAEYPVPGLGFGEDEVIYRGYPFNQISNAEQIRCAVAIGMAAHPELRVMRIKDGSLLDAEAMEILAEMAKAHDTQVWIEVVDTTGKVGVYLEDGEVEAVNEEPLNQPKAERKPAAKKRTKKEAASA